MRYICTVNNCRKKRKWVHCVTIFDYLWETLSQKLRIGLRFWKYDRIRSVIRDSVFDVT